MQGELISNHRECHYARFSGLARSFSRVPLWLSDKVESFDFKLLLYGNPRMVFFLFMVI